VTPRAVAEAAWHACCRQLGAASDDWLGDIENPFIMFHWQRESFAVLADGEFLF
jgi:hypothetical protein